MGSVVYSFTELRSLFHEHEGIETVLEECASDFLRLDGKKYMPCESLAKFDLLDEWNSVHGHYRRIIDVLTLIELPYETRLRYSKGIVFHCAEINQRTLDEAKRKGAKEGRDLYLDYYFTSSYILGIARTMRTAIGAMDETGQDLFSRTQEQNAEKIRELSQKKGIRAFNWLKEHNQAIARFARNLIGQVREYENTLQQGLKIEVQAAEHSRNIREAEYYIERAIYRISYDILNTANQLAYTTVDLPMVMKTYLLRDALSLVEGEKQVPSIASKTCRLLSILEDDHSLEKRMLLEKGLEYRARFTDPCVEDSVERAYFHLHLARTIFIQDKIFDTDHWESFISFAESALQDLSSERGFHLRSPARVLHHLFDESYHFFSTMDKRRAHCIARFSGAGPAQLDRLILTYGHSLDRLIYPHALDSPA